MKKAFIILAIVWAACGLFWIVDMIQDGIDAHNIFGIGLCLLGEIGQYINYKAWKKRN